MNTLVPSFMIGCSDNMDNHKVLDEFEIQPDPTIDCGVSCSLKSEKIFYLLETIQDIFMTCWLSCERSLPFGLNVFIHAGN